MTARGNHFCGLCGGSVDPDVGQPHDAAHGQVTWRVACAVCRVDRVQRWGDLMQASAREGHELRRLVFPPDQHPGTARLAAEAGLVRYVRDDCSWELTDDGTALLSRFDAKRGTP